MEIEENQKEHNKEQHVSNNCHGIGLENNRTANRHVYIRKIIK